MFFYNFTFCEHATFKILVLTTGFGNFFVLHRILGSSSRPVAINHCCVLSNLQENHWFFKCFHLSIDKRFFASLATLARDRYQHDVLQGAHVPNSLLCVTFGAPRFGTPNHSFCKCSTYITFSTTLCAPVLRTTMCVAPRARRRSVPRRVLGDRLAASAA